MRMSNKQHIHQLNETFYHVDKHLMDRDMLTTFGLSSEFGISFHEIQQVKNKLNRN